MLSKHYLQVKHIHYYEPFIALYIGLEVCIAYCYVQKCAYGPGPDLCQMGPSRNEGHAL